MSMHRDNERVESIGARGIEPASQETYGNGVRKVIYRDPDGTEIGFGGASASSVWPCYSRHVRTVPQVTVPGTSSAARTPIGPGRPVPASCSHCAGDAGSTRTRA